MNKKIKSVILIAVLTIVIALAVWAYNTLSEDYDKGKLIVEEKDGKEPLMAADFSVLDNDGNAVRLSDKFGRPIVVNFWATWCGPCKMEMPAFDNLFKEYGGSVEFMMVNQTAGGDTIESATEFIEENGYGFPVYYDTNGESAYVYGINSIPVTLFINEDGEIEDAIIGAMDEAVLKEKLEKLID